MPLASTWPAVSTAPTEVVSAVTVMQRAGEVLLHLRLREFLQRTKAVSQRVLEDLAGC